MKKYLLFILLAGCSILQQTPPTIEPARRIAPPKPGLDILSLPRQDVSMIKRYLKPGTGIGTFHGPFGSAVKSLDSVLSTKKAPFFRVHFSFCKHGASCGPGECKLNDLPCIGKKSDQINALAKKYPSITCLISPYAEYFSKSRSQVEAWFKIIRGRAPSCIPVASTIGGYVPPFTMIEKHGNNPGRAAITSNDGSNYYDSNSLSYNGMATDYSLAWTNRANLRLTSEKGTPLPPMQRPLSNRLEPQDIVQMQLMQLPETQVPAIPKQCKVIKQIVKPNLFKTRSEDYGAKNDAKANKPMLIMKERVSRYEILAPDGRNVGCFKYYGPYSEGGYRYYEGSCSGFTATTLYRRAKGENVFVQRGSTCYPISIIRRKGYYRP